MKYIDIATPPLVWPKGALLCRGALAGNSIVALISSIPAWELCLVRQIGEYAVRNLHRNIGAGVVRVEANEFERACKAT